MTWTIEQSIIIEVWKEGFGSWKASWRPEDDPQWDHMDDAQRKAWVEFDFFSTGAWSEKAVIRRARKKLQSNAKRAEQTVRQQLLEDKTFRRVEVFIDVTKLREAEADAAKPT
jgi:hypothetical protein